MTFLSFAPLTYASTNYQSEVSLACQFLLSLYDEEVGLLKESPLLQQNRFGLQSDNYLASVALELRDIENRLTELGYAKNCKYEAIFSDTVFSLPFVIQEFKPIYENTLARDGFNRSVLGDDWGVTGGEWTVEDGWLKGEGGKHLAYFNGSTSMNADVTVRMRMTEGTYFGAVLRYVDPRNFVACWLNTLGSGQAVLQSVIDGYYQTIDWTWYPVELGEVYTMRFELLNDIHRMWINDFSEGAEPVLQGSGEVALTEGYAGVMVDDGVTAFFDDFAFVDYRIFNAFDTERVQSDFEEYTDLCFVASAIKFNLREIAESRRLFMKGLSYWDGVGFKDSHLQGAYTTYQLALALVVANKIGYDLRGLRRTLESTLWGLQRDDGGISTHYTDIGVHYGSGEPNCETTCFAVLSEKEPFRPSGNTFDQMLSQVLLVAGVVVLMVVLFIFVRRVL